MYKNRAKDGRNNITGRAIARYRLQMPDNPSQNGLAALLQVNGLDLDKNAIQRIECGKRFVTDIEILAFCRVFNMKPSEFLGLDDK